MMRTPASKPSTDEPDFDYEYFRFVARLLVSLAVDDVLAALDTGDVFGALRACRTLDHYLSAVRRELAQRAAA